MTTEKHRGRCVRTTAGLLIGALLAAILVTVTAGVAAASESTKIVWDRDDTSPAGFPDPATWKFRQSCVTGTPYQGDDVVCPSDLLGSRDAADPDLVLDATWSDIDALDVTGSGTYKRDVGPNVANHFRKEFTLGQVGLAYHELTGIEFSVFYDDTAAVYFNGNLVYRSIRGNIGRESAVDTTVDMDGLDPTLNFPYDIAIGYGGAEYQYIEVPEINAGNNACESPVVGCVNSPYSPFDEPPAVPLSYFRDSNGNGVIDDNDVQVWGVTTWNNNNGAGGSGDTSFNHTFSLVYDSTQSAPQQVQINEVVASNDTSWLVQTEPGGQPESPDWIELHNFSNDQSIDIGGWSLSDESGDTYVFPPATVLAARGNALNPDPASFLMIAANGCDPAQGDVCTDGHPHQAPFRLSREGDLVLLVRDTGQIEHATGLMPRQFSDVSYGLAPSGGGSFSYLADVTPSARNSAAGANFPAVLRLFPDRLYNVGEGVSHQIDAFDPDGDPIGYSIASGPPGVMHNAGTGMLTGAVTQAGIFDSTISATEADGGANQAVQWRVYDAAPGGSPLVLNEYNAVPADRELGGGSALGNGGDWFEFLVVEDGLDLRGWSIELWDKKGADDQTRLAATLTFTDDARLASFPAGTLVVIGEEVVDDLSHGGPGGNDWTVHMHVDADANGLFFEDAANQSFSSTRKDQVVVIRDAGGTLRTPIAGETEAWDRANGGVGGGDVMNFCVDPVAGDEVDPVADYRDNGTFSTQGEPNRCRWIEEVNGAQVAMDFDQDFDALRATAMFGAAGADVNCDGQVNPADAHRALLGVLEVSVDVGPCLFSGALPTGQFSGLAADINNDGDLQLPDTTAILICYLHGTCS